MLIYLARHGETELNRRGIRQGSRFDSPLTARGIKHARSLAQLLTGKHLTAIYSSQLGRAKATVEHLTALIPESVPVIFTYELNELSLGSLDGTTAKQREQEYPVLARAREQDKLHFRFPEGENYQDVLKRTDSLVRSFKKPLAPEVIAVVGHESTNRIVLMLLLDLRFYQAERISQPNNLVYRIRLTPDQDPLSHFTKDYGSSWSEGLHLRC